MSDPIRELLDAEMSYHRTDCCGESEEPCQGTLVVAALYAVLDLHPVFKEGTPECTVCWPNPCPERHAISAALGVSEPTQGDR